MRPIKHHAYHHGDLRRGLIQASLAIIARKGVHALSVREAAAHLGVSSAAPYRHFPNKSALITAIAIEGYAALKQALQQAIGRYPGDLKEQLFACAQAYIRFALKNPEQVKLMYSVAVLQDSPELERVHQETESQFFQLIEAAQKQRIIISGDPILLATVAFTYIHGLAILLIEKHLDAVVPSSLPLEGWVRQLTEVVWKGFAFRGRSAVPRPAGARKKQIFRTSL